VGFHSVVLSIFCRRGDIRFVVPTSPVHGPQDDILFWIGMEQRMRHLVAIALVLAGTLAPAAAKPEPVASPAQSCDALVRLALPNASITFAHVVDAGVFITPTASSGAQTFSDLPAFCRVAATLKPSSDSEIKTEVWLPVTGWNGKFLAAGSGGWGGSIAYQAMDDALRRGYATSATDDGHTGPSGSFALGHPEKFIDFAYRSEHEMAVKAKAIINTFYGRNPRYSYWDGCSGGGREGLLQAQRYPDEFDGIIAGDPATFRRNAWALWLANASFKDPVDFIPPSKYPMIHQAVLDACDAMDGLKDGLIDDPTRCHFDPKVLQCVGGDTPSCLTSRQVQTARTILSPATTSNGREIFPRLEPGTELRWGRLAGGPEPAALFVDYFKYIVFKDPNWDWKTFDLDRDFALSDEIDKGTIALNPDLKRFAEHGGKLLIYHGWADQQVAPVASVDFYKSVVDTSADPSQSLSWARLFMAPGMAHCAGGEGPNTFDEITAMEQWVEKGKAPDQIIASHSTSGKIDRTRPLCPYPKVARYQGTGSHDEAANFTCQPPQPGDK
jgi:feruloyl esterase